VESNNESSQLTVTQTQGKDGLMKLATKLQDLGLEELKKITPRTAQMAAIIRIFETVRLLIANQNNVD
jgi:hypothetical protein